MIPADRVTIVNSRLRTVGDRLTTRNLDSYPTGTLEVTPAPTCPCHTWASHPGVRLLKGHAFFRDPSVLQHLFLSVDDTVFCQNFKNATFPSWSRFESDLKQSLDSLCKALPDHRNACFVSVHSHLMDLCRQLYGTCRALYPSVYMAPMCPPSAGNCPPHL